MFKDLLKKSSDNLVAKQLSNSQHHLYTEDRHSTISVDNADSSRQNLQTVNVILN